MPVIALTARLFDQYYTRSQFENLFYHSGTAVESPGGNKVDTITHWLRAVNRDEPQTAFVTLGKLLEDFMEREVSTGSQYEKDRESLHALLGKYGLRYVTGGKIIRAASMAGSSTATLATILKQRDFPAVHDEFQRATENVETKPREAVSAAANILEAICKEYIVQHPHLSMPSKQDLSGVFGVVRKDLGFDPSAIEDDDLKAILGGLIATAGGIAALRTHASSAHAQGTSKRGYRLTPRHARLAIHAAHALVAFILETWEQHDGTT